MAKKKKNEIKEYKTFKGIVNKFKSILQGKDAILLFAHNGVGKTRLSIEFKNIQKKYNNHIGNTLYFNAFTEDLFYWDNDIKKDSTTNKDNETNKDNNIKKINDIKKNNKVRTLYINQDTKFFSGLEGINIKNKVQEELRHYADFDFKIDEKNWKISFSRITIDIIGKLETTLERMTVVTNSMNEQSEIIIEKKELLKKMKDILENSQDILSNPTTLPEIKKELEKQKKIDNEIDEKNEIQTHKAIILKDINEQVATYKEVKEQTDIKISRGEESLFMWCFFLAIVKLAINGHDDYKWVEYIYIDDPVSSLDDNNVIAIAHHLAQIIKTSNKKIIISTHHALFFNVMYNELKDKKTTSYLLTHSKEKEKYFLENTEETPFLYHIITLRDLEQAYHTERIYSYHFNMLRAILEKTAIFHGFQKISDILDPEDEELCSRVLNALSHDKYSYYESKEMPQTYKKIFKNILKNFVDKHHFNKDIINLTTTQEDKEND